MKSIYKVKAELVANISSEKALYRVIIATDPVSTLGVSKSVQDIGWFVSGAESLKEEQNFVVKQDPQKNQLREMEANDPSWVSINNNVLKGLDGGETLMNLSSEDYVALATHWGRNRDLEELANTLRKIPNLGRLLADHFKWDPVTQVASAVVQYKATKKYYVVTYLGLDAISTYGNTLSEAYNNAKQCLQHYLDCGGELPKPRNNVKKQKFLYKFLIKTRSVS
jgi:predicted RNase H-like HicB family nuclease